MSEVMPRPRPGRQPGAFDRAVQRPQNKAGTSLRDRLDRTAARRRAVGDDEAARQADAWAAELDGAA
jgi:hypothetical protein